MKNHISLICSLLLTVVFGCTSCSDDCDHYPLNGTDTDITQWSMQTAEGLSFAGLISNNTVTVCLPEEVSINSLSAAYTLSEGATIYPNPESITDWSAEQTFTVTSVNTENEKVWTVKILRAGDGELLTPVSITSQSALEEFAALGYRKLNNLTIADGTEPVTDLSPLKNIEEVTSRLSIRNVTAANVEMGGLQIVGDLSVNSYETLVSVSFPALRRAMGSIYIGDGQGGSSSSVPKIHNNLKTVDFPQLTYVAGSFTVYWCQNTERVNTNKLSHIGRDYIIDTGMLTDYSMLQSLRTIPGNLRLFFNSVESFDGFNISSIGGSFFFSAGKVNSLKPLECLKQVADFSINGGDNITSLEGISHLNPKSVTINALPKLTSLQGIPLGSNTSSVFIQRMPLLSSISGMETLKKAETIQISGCPLVKDITPICGITSAGSLILTSMGVETIPEFPNLTELPGTLEIYNDDNLTSLAGFAHLQSLGKLTISECALLTSLNGLQNVTTCPGAIQIVSNPELVSFTAVRDLLINNWKRVTIRRNKYNPTLEQLQNGQTEL